MLALRYPCILDEVFLALFGLPDPSGSVAAGLGAVNAPLALFLPELPGPVPAGLLGAGWGADVAGACLGAVVAGVCLGAVVAGAALATGLLAGLAAVGAAVDGAAVGAAVGCADDGAAVGAVGGLALFSYKHLEGNLIINM